MYPYEQEASILRAHREGKRVDFKITALDKRMEREAAFVRTLREEGRSVFNPIRRTEYESR